MMIAYMPTILIVIGLILLFTLIYAGHGFWAWTAARGARD